MLRIMITIPNTNFKADNVSLAQILNGTTKLNMLTMGNKFDLYVSPDLPFYLDCAIKGVKAPSARDLRMSSMLQRLYGVE